MGNPKIPRLTEVFARHLDEADGKTRFVVWVAENWGPSLEVVEADSPEEAYRLCSRGHTGGVLEPDEHGFLSDGDNTVLPASNARHLRSLAQELRELFAECAVSPEEAEEAAQAAWPAELGSMPRSDRADARFHVGR